MNDSPKSAPTPTDSRFFPGYTWISDDPDGRIGLCMPSTDPREAARLYLRNRLAYYNAGRTFAVYATSSPGDTPERIEITA